MRQHALEIPPGVAEDKETPADKARIALFGPHHRALVIDLPPLGGNRPDVRPPQKHHPLDPTLYGRFSHHLLYKGSFWAAIPRSAATGRRSDVWERDYRLPTDFHAPQLS